jgi:hypothetical protein
MKCLEADDYYISRSRELLARFDRDARNWRPILAQRYGADHAEAILGEGRNRFEGLIPELPYIGTPAEPPRWMAQPRGGDGRPGPAANRFLTFRLAIGIIKPRVLPGLLAQAPKLLSTHGLFAVPTHKTA